MKTAPARFVRLAGLLAMAVLGALPGSGATLQTFNEDKIPGFYYWAHPSGTMGWYWTAPFDMNLESIETKLNTRGFNTNNNFILTTTLYTERPAVGGSELGSFDYNASGYGGGWTGGAFSSPLSLIGGTRYFIGFSGWEQVLTGGGGGGVNWTEPAEYPPGTIFDDLFPFYLGTNFETQASPGPDPVNIDMPILQFIGTVPSPAAVPEPGSIAMLALGTTGIAVLRLRRRV